MFPKVWVVVMVTVGVGMLVGSINGLLIAKLNLAAFVVTLGVLYVARGVTEVMLNGQNLTNELAGRAGLGNTGFLAVFASRPLGVPISAWVMIVVAVAISVMLNRTPFGRWLYASGGNERAAGCSGVPVKRVKTRVYVLSGVCAGIVGVLSVASSALDRRPRAFYELNAIAAVVIGGAALSGGRGTMLGTMPRRLRDRLPVRRARHHRRLAVLADGLHRCGDRARGRGRTDPAAGPEAAQRPSRRRHARMSRRSEDPTGVAAGNPADRSSVQKQEPTPTDQTGPTSGPSGPVA